MRCIFVTAVFAACWGLPLQQASGSATIIRIDASPDPVVIANAISADGSTVVGRSFSDQGLNRAIRWSSSGGVRPLGIAPPEWGAIAEGYSLGGYGLFARTEDIAKFGQLYLQKGK